MSGGSPYPPRFSFRVPILHLARKLPNPSKKRHLSTVAVSPDRVGASQTPTRGSDIDRNSYQQRRELPRITLASIMHETPWRDRGDGLATGQPKGLKPDARAPFPNQVGGSPVLIGTEEGLLAAVSSRREVMRQPYCHRACDSGHDPSPVRPPAGLNRYLWYLRNSAPVPHVHSYQLRLNGRFRPPKCSSKPKNSPPFLHLF